MPDDAKAKRPFEQVPVELLEDKALTEAEIVYYILLVKLSHVDGYCSMSSRELGKLRGKGMRTAQRVVESLKKKGYIKTVVYTDERGKSHRKISPIRYVKYGRGVRFDIGGYDKSDEGAMTDLSPTYVKNGTQIILNNHTDNNHSANQDLHTCAPFQKSKTDREGQSAKGEWFSEFWQAYPARQGKKQGRKAAEKAFCKIKNLPELFPRMMQALEKQKGMADWQKEDGKYIPLASTWLNGARWEDELSTQAQPPASGPVIPTQADIEAAERKKAADKEKRLAAYREKLRKERSNTP